MDQHVYLAEQANFCGTFLATAIFLIYIEGSFLLEYDPKKFFFFISFRNYHVMKMFSDRGIPTRETPFEIAESSDVVITMLPSSSHVGLIDLLGISKLLVVDAASGILEYNKSFTQYVMSL